eukprot:scaffold159729_cov22-Tisochrysis_lutea.AAC.2
MNCDIEDELKASLKQGATNVCFDDKNALHHGSSPQSHAIKITLPQLKPSVACYQDHPISLAKYRPDTYMPTCMSAGRGSSPQTHLPLSSFTRTCALHTNAWPPTLGCSFPRNHAKGELEVSGQGSVDVSVLDIVLCMMLGAYLTKTALRPGHGIRGWTWQRWGSEITRPRADCDKAALDRLITQHDA